MTSIWFIEWCMVMGSKNDVHALIEEQAHVIINIVAGKILDKDLSFQSNPKNHWSIFDPYHVLQIASL